MRERAPAHGDMTSIGVNRLGVVCRGMVCELVSAPVHARTRSVPRPCACTSSCAHVPLLWNRGVTCRMSTSASGSESATMFLCVSVSESWNRVSVCHRMCSRAGTRATCHRLCSLAGTRATQRSRTAAPAQISRAYRRDIRG